MLKLSSSGLLPVRIEARAISRPALPQIPAKIAYKTNCLENRPQDKGKNRLQDKAKNRPDIINPVRLLGVIAYDGLKALLISEKQRAWCTRVRIHGLLLLIDYILRNLKRGRISIPADLAHQFVSKLRRKDCPTTLTEPLLVLCKIEILTLLHPAIFAHVQASAIYCLGKPYQNRTLTLEATLTPKLRAKREHADERREHRLNLKYPFRKQLLADLNEVSFAPQARPIIARRINAKNAANLTALLRAIDGQQHFVRVSERGQITTTIGSCLCELRPYLLLHGEPTVSCDIANAHWNFLPLILANRLDFLSGLPDRKEYINDGWREHNRLVALLSDGDFYRAWCVDSNNDGERDDKKTILNILLNSKNEACEKNVLYQRMKASFPITLRIVEDIKRDDNRNLSKQLHRFTANAVGAALLEEQRNGVALIPHVDSLICQEKNRERVCKALGKEIFAATGVCSAVGGIRYSPLTDVEAEALAFDESAPSDDGMSYDEWEAVRLVKCVAAMKLMRRCPPLFAPLAMCSLIQAS